MVNNVKIPLENITTLNVSKIHETIHDIWERYELNPNETVENYRGLL